MHAWLTRLSVREFKLVDPSELIWVLRFPHGQSSAGRGDDLHEVSVILSCREHATQGNIIVSKGNDLFRAKAHKSLTEDHHLLVCSLVDRTHVYGEIIRHQFRQEGLQVVVIPALEHEAEHLLDGSEDVTTSG